MFAVKHSPFDMIPQVIKRGEDDTKRPASVMRKEPRHVFKKKIRRSLLFNHSGQFKEESTSCIFKSFPPASCRKRLAGEASAQEVKVGEFFGVNGSCVGIVDFLLSGRVDGAIAGVCIFVDFAMTDTLKSACKV